MLGDASHLQHQVDRHTQHVETVTYMYMYTGCISGGGANVHACRGLMKPSMKPRYMYTCTCACTVHNEVQCSMQGKVIHMYMYMYVQLESRWTGCTVYSVHCALYRCMRSGVIRMNCIPLSLL